MQIEDLKKEFGTYAAAARAVGVPKQSIRTWKVTTGEIPLHRQFQFEELTSGRLKANPSRAILIKNKEKILKKYDASKHLPTLPCACMVITSDNPEQQKARYEGDGMFTQKDSDGSLYDITEVVTHYIVSSAIKTKRI